MKLPAYPKVWNLGHPQVRELTNGQCWVQEKVDGSQFSFGRIGGELYFKSHKQEVFPGGAGMFEEGVQYLLSIADRIHEGYLYRAEYFRRPKHNALAYERIPRNHFMLFDVQRQDDWREGGFSDYCMRCFVADEAKRLEIELVPELWVGADLTVDICQQLLDTDSVLGGQKVEGIVVKGYDRYGDDGHVLMGKYVCERFRELNAKSHASTQRKGVMEEICDSIEREPIWVKAVQRRREAGELQLAPQDIGPLMKSIHEDVDAEMRDIVAQRLLRQAMAQVKRAATRGFAEWYKEQLLAKQFEIPESD